MREKLIHNLLQYIKENNPEFLHQMENEVALMQWLSEKVKSVSALMEQMKKKRQPEYAIEESCMEELTKDLRPSRFNYIRHILDEEFENDYLRMTNSGVLRFEIINLIQQCQSTFNDLRFAEENEDNRFTRYAITGVIREYLEENRVDEIVSYVLQQPSEVQG